MFLLVCEPHGIYHPLAPPSLLTHLHASREGHPFAEDLVQWSCAHRIAERRLGQESRRMVCILDVGYGHRRIEHAIIHDSVHGHGYTVLGEHLKRWRM